MLKVNCQVSNSMHWTRQNWHKTKWMFPQMCPPAWPTSLGQGGRSEEGCCRWYQYGREWCWCWWCWYQFPFSTPSVHLPCCPGSPSAPPPVARHTWRPDSRYTQNMWRLAVTGGTLGHYNYSTIIHWDTRIIKHWNTGTLENSTLRYWKTWWLITETLRTGTQGH